MRLGWRERRLLKALYPAVEKKEYFTRELISRKIMAMMLKDAISVRKKESEKKLYWRAFHRLKRRGYVAPVAILIKLSLLLGTPQMTEIRKRANPYWTLTEKGREAALKILGEEKEEEQLKETLKLLVKEGKTEATLNEVREKLWEITQTFFRSREEFQEYWTERRLGLALKRIGVNWRRVGKKRICLYNLTGTQGVDTITSKTSLTKVRFPAYHVYLNTVSKSRQGGLK